MVKKEKEEEAKNVAPKKKEDGDAKNGGPKKTKKPGGKKGKKEKDIGMVAVNADAVKEDEDDMLAEQKHKSEGTKQEQLCAAGYSGDMEAATKLLDKGVDINCSDDYGKTPLHHATTGKRVAFIEFLISRGADLTRQDQRGDTPLHAAVRTGDESIVKTLLANEKCNVNAVGRALCTPLHIACGMDKLNICKLLIEHGATIDRRDEDRMTPLGHAVEKGAKTTAAYMFKIVKNEIGDMEEFLYQADSEGSTLLHMAVESGVTEIVEMCLESGARVREPKDKQRLTAFHLACSQGPVQMVKLMVAKDPAICRITLIDKDGMSPLHRAAANNQKDVVEFLLDNGSYVDLPDKSRRTPLFMAASNGGTETVKLLLSRGANVTAKNVANESVLHGAVGHMKTTEALLKSPGASYLIPEKDRKGYAPIHHAARGGYLQNIHLFMTKNKAAAGITADSLDTPLHVACKFGWLEVVDDLLVGRNVRMINLKNNRGKTPLHFASGEGHDRVVELLLARGATIERDQSERTPLHLAAVTGSRRSVECILAKHPDCLNAVDEDQNTALNLAAENGHTEIVKHFLSIKEQDILMNNFNQNALDIAIKKEKEEVAMAMAENDRWRELMNTSSPGGLGQMKVLLIKMPEVAERIMDRSILKEGDPLKQNYKITYDFTFLQGKIGKLPYKQDPLAVQRAMANYRREKCLVHQVAFHLMNVKWQTFGWLSLWANLLIYMLYLMPLTALAVHAKQNEAAFCHIVNHTMASKLVHGSPYHCASHDTVSRYLHFFVIFMTALLSIREFHQMNNNRLQYFLYLPNYMEWTAYICTFLYVVLPCDCKRGTQIQFGAISMFFSWLNLILYFRKFSFYGQYVIMLATIFVTLAKVLLLFFLFVMSFGITFYLLLENVESFAHLEHSLMTTFVMTLGEMNYGDTFMPWNKLLFPELINILFIIFALAMPIILMNMLVGLAVGDIDSIQKNAVMDRYVMQIEMLLDTEEALPRRIRRGFKFDKFVEYPNQPVKLRTKIYNAIFGFEHPNTNAQEELIEEEKEKTEQQNAYNKLQEQENRINQIYELLQLQSQMLHKMSNPDEEEGESTKKISRFFLLSSKRSPTKASLLE